MIKNFLSIVLSTLLFINFSTGQQALQLNDCENKEFEINDNNDSDGDGNICEAKIQISNSASYTENAMCDLSSIEWVVFVDLGKDGTIDLEYRSSLPDDDTTLDDTNGNGIPDLYIPPTLNNELQNIALPDIEGAMSEHNVAWEVFDACDYEDNCSMDFVVLDKKAPTPFCISLATVMLEGDETEVQAATYNIGAFDNCTAQEDILISFSPDEYMPTRIFTCEDVQNSPILQNVYFSDPSGNSQYCQVYISVTTNNEHCCNDQKEIHGVVKDWNGNPMEDVEVCLDANLVEYPRCQVTDEDGLYSFGCLDEGIEYALFAIYEDYPTNGVSTLDLVYIQRYILGIEPFSSPYQIIASDINGDMRVTAHDLRILRLLILGVLGENPYHKNWNFINADFKFNDPLNPFFFMTNYKEEPFIIRFNEIEEEGFDFIGIKTGNVTGN